jgi:fibronectin type 3 domain-containing protein
MKIIRNIPASKSALLYFLILLPFRANVCRAAAPPVPQTFQDLYTTLNTDLSLFNTTLSTIWNGSKYPVLYSVDLSTADANSGPQLINAGYMTGVLNQLQSYKAMGATAVMVQVGFPMLYEPFFSSSTVYQQYVSFYQQVAANARALGLKLIVENNCLLSNDVQAGWNTAPFYATLNWTEYQQARAQTAAVIAQTMRPDYLIVLEEPDTEATQANQPNVNTVSGATSLITTILTSVGLSGVSGMQVGAGVGTWLANFILFIQSFVTLPLNFIDMHIYQVNVMGPPGNANYLANALTIATTAAAAGKPLTMSEAWMWKVRNSELGVMTADEIRARNPFSFWAPLDADFLQTMENLANYSHMIFMDPTGSYYMWAYLQYNSTTSSMSPAQIISQEITTAGQAAAQAQYTSTGMSYYHSLVSSDTIPPSTPGSLGIVSGTPTSASLSWTASTDNVGVAGYHILRDGVKVATTVETYYQDSSLTQNTTYNYAVVAFDLAGNTSVPATASVTTRNGTTPNPPANFNGTAISGQEISLSWSVPPGNIPISSYLLFRGTSSTNLTQLTQLNGTTTSFNNYYLTPGTTYYYGVKAVSSGLVSPMSTIIAVKTLAAPSKPANVTASAQASDRVNLTWSASSGGMPIAAYHVFRGASSSSLTQVANRSGTSYIDTAVAPSTTYYYAVQAVDTGGDSSPMSRTVLATTPVMPAAPQNMSATAVSGTQVTVTWFESTKGLPIASYRIFRGTSPSSLNQVAVRSATSYTDTTVSPSTAYYYGAEAVDNGGDVSVMSAIASVTTP